MAPLVAVVEVQEEEVVPGTHRAQVVLVRSGKGMREALDCSVAQVAAAAPVKWEKTHLPQMMVETAAMETQVLFRVVP